MNGKSLTFAESKLMAPPSGLSFGQRVMRLAEAARCLAADHHGQRDREAMIIAVQGVEACDPIGGDLLKEGLALTSLVRAFLNADGVRPYLRKAIGALAADILSGQGGGHGV